MAMLYSRNKQSKRFPKKFCVGNNFGFLLVIGVMAIAIAVCLAAMTNAAVDTYQFIMSNQAAKPDPNPTKST